MHVNIKHHNGRAKMEKHWNEGFFKFSFFKNYFPFCINLALPIFSNQAHFFFITSSLALDYSFVNKYDLLLNLSGGEQTVHFSDSSS